MPRVMVVESDVAFAEEIRLALETHAVEVQVVSDGNEALQVAKSAGADLILLRVELPKISGYSICNKLKKSSDPRVKSIPLVVISSEATPEIFAAGEDVRVTVFAKNRSGSALQFGIGSSSCQLAGAVRVAGEDAPMIIHRICLADMSPWRLDPGEERTETWTWKGTVRLDGAAQALPPGEYEVTGVAGDYRAHPFKNIRGRQQAAEPVGCDG